MNARPNPPGLTGITPVGFRTPPISRLRPETAGRGDAGWTVAVRFLGFTAGFTLVVSGALHPQPPQPGLATEPIIGLPCEGCEAVFQGLPETLTSQARIAPEGEPGEPMVIEGTILDADGRPVSGVIVYAYHTDARGVYPRDGRLSGAAMRHGRLRGWAETDQDGRYVFNTIRPASYPSRDTPAHVHMHVIEPGCCTYYIDAIHFADDPLLMRRERREMAEGRGGSGLVHPQRDTSGVWHATRDIVLGEGVPGYTT